MEAKSEKDVERYLVRLAKYNGGETRKVRWIGRNSAPDRVVMLPGGILVWVECKAPGEKPDDAQAREHDAMRKLGQQVEVVDCYLSVLNLFVGLQ